MLSALRLRLSKIVSILNKQSKIEEIEDPSAEASPWKQNLRDLAKERLARIGAEPVPQDEIASFVNDLAHAAGDVDPKVFKVKKETEGGSGEIEPAKSKRIMDGTVQDVKAWYGQSVGTWDPVNGNSLASIDQKRRTRPENHWFH